MHAPRWTISTAAGAGPGKMTADISRLRRGVFPRERTCLGTTAKERGPAQPQERPTVRAARILGGACLTAASRLGDRPLTDRRERVVGRRAELERFLRSR